MNLKIKDRSSNDLFGTLVIAWVVALSLLLSLTDVGQSWMMSHQHEVQFYYWTTSLMSYIICVRYPGSKPNPVGDLIVGFFFGWAIWPLLIVYAHAKQEGGNRSGRRNCS